MTNSPRIGARTVLPLLAIMVCLVACGKTATGPEHPPEAGDVAVARLNGHTIWTSDVRNEAIAQGAIGQGEPLDITSDLFSRTLEEVIDQRLLADDAVKQGIDRSIVAQRRLQAARDRILGDMLVENTIDRDIDDKAIKAQYDEQVRLAKTSNEIRARIMVLKTKADAQAALQQVQGGAGFEALAMEKSVDQATRFNGGDMGYFTEDMMPASYKSVLTTAKVGDTVGPVQVDNGWAIFRVEERRPEQVPTLDQERPIIMRYLVYNQVAGLLNNLRNHARVERLIAGPSNPADDPPPATASDDSANSAGDSEAQASTAASSAAPPVKAAPSPAAVPEVLKVDPLPPGHHYFAPPKLKK
ncbi:peptidylprolyl isomerase [Asticcacaulis sp. EMRT-3]|uniref:peptidylprolyl isomerase n=1 Tax=Asticcacaulis sp. EMRT-3 TaxID=3040349 RepID=UPI0024AF3A88|nr:peptidylprolyl isomerase [Asticcacaulis sp. EMRT-3]MDI7776068.1 peptidylprolyl isomerase [Asticcacaulis sp. EMRT-3]